MMRRTTIFACILLIISICLVTSAGVLIEEPSEKPTVKPTVTPTATPTPEPSEKPTVKPTVTPTATPTPEPTVPPIVDTVDIKATYYVHYDSSGENIYYLSPEPIEYKIDDETLTKEDLFVEKKTLTDTKERTDELTKEEEDRLAILEKADTLREPYMDATVILEGYPDTEKLAFYSRTDEIKAAEKAAGIEYPYHMVWVDGAETLNGSIIFPKNTYSRVYALKEINGTIEVVDLDEYIPVGELEREPKRPYYEIKDGQTVVYMDGFSGAGTEVDPWQVATFEDLRHVGCNDVSGDYAYWNSTDYYIQTADIYCNGYFTPIGRASPYFTGQYDGDGYVISNLTISSSTLYTGLFGRTADATIKNVKLIDINISCSSTYCGGLIGWMADGTLEDCSVAGSMVASGSASQMGGLVGYVREEGIIDDCYTNVSIDINSGCEYVGGLVGYNPAGTISRCYVLGTLDENGSVYCDGFVGHQAGTGTSSDSFCYEGAFSSITGATSRNLTEMADVGTYTNWDITASESNWDGQEWYIDDGNAYPILWYEMDGVTGQGSGTSGDPWQVANYTDLKYVGSELANGKYAGWNLDSHYIQTDDIQAPTGADQENFERIGDETNRFTGVYDGDGHIIHDLYQTNYGVSGYPSYYGMFSRIDGGLVKNLKLVDADFYFKYRYNGILAGNTLNGGKIQNCSVSGNINVTWAAGYVGGIVGANGVSTDSGKGSGIWDCYSDVDIVTVTYDHFGTVAGVNYYGNIVRTYSTGSLVEGGRYYNDGFCGRLIGGSYLDNYCHEDAYPTISGATSCNTSQMQNITTYTNWDISTIPEYSGEVWYIDDGIDFPRLWYELGATDPPVANFSANCTVIEENEYIAFTDESTNLPTSWLWYYDCGSGWVQFSTAKNPEYQFTEAGNYSIKLNVSNNVGSDELTKLGYINVTEGFPPSNVGNLTSTNVTYTTITWNWTDPDDSNFNYCEIYLDSGLGFIYQDDVAADIESWVAQGLDPATEYTVKVISVSLSGCKSDGVTDGAATNAPIEVASYEDLKHVGCGDTEGTYAGWNLNDYYSQIMDIQCPVGAEREAFTQIGDVYDPFTGVYNGNGYVIADLYLSPSTSPSSAYKGLFGYIDTGGMVENLILEDVYVQVDNATNYVGALAGRSYGTIRRCGVTGEINITSDTASTIGGLCGQITAGTIEDCYTDVRIKISGSQNNYVAGLVGFANAGAVERCYSRGVVDQGNTECGGFFGRQVTTTYSTNLCYNGSHSSIIGASSKTMDELKDLYAYTQFIDYTDAWDININEHWSDEIWCLDSGVDTARLWFELENISGQGSGTEQDPWQVTSEFDLKNVGCNALNGRYNGWDSNSYYIQVSDLNNFIMQGQGWGTGIANGIYSEDFKTYLDVWEDWVGYNVIITGGKGEGQIRSVSRVWNLDPPTILTYPRWVSGSAPDSSSTFIIVKTIHTPVGNAQEPFTGEYDGGGNTIEYLRLNTSSGYTGLFGYIAANGSVHSVKLEDVQVKSSYGYMGVLAGYLAGNVEYCSVSGNLIQTGAGDNVGGMVGLLSSESNLTNCYANVSLVVDSESNNIGGVVGLNDEGTVQYCYNIGNVTGGDEYVSGFIGQNVLGVSADNYCLESSYTNITGATSKNVASMQNIDTYVNWNIVGIESWVDEIWYIDDGNDYPRLWYELEETGGSAPIANFTANVTSGDAPLAVQFNSTSVNATAWNWSFGDGNYSASENPLHTYVGAGTYNVSLHVTNSYGDDWKNETAYIAVNATYLPTANFTANVTEGDAPLIVGFTDTSINATSWNWSFGDGNYSTDQNVSHTYATLGVFDVKLHVQNDDGDSWKNETAYINVTNNLTANFTSNVTYGNKPLTVQFNSTSINATAWNWSFGDGNYSIEENPVYIYNSTGLYNVTLTIWNAFGTTNKSEIEYISVTAAPTYPPEAGFTANVTSGKKPLSVQFTSTSINATAWNWSFGDGNYSESENPIHTYVNAGIYDVHLLVTNDDGSDWENKTGYITVDETYPPEAGFTANVTSGKKPLSVQFTSTSINATAWNWSFGDGNYSESENPIHTYVNAGIYDVHLLVTNDDGSDWENKTGYITVDETYPPEAGFTANVTNGYAPLVVGFTDLSVNATTWNWSFGDGYYSEQQNPSHTYTGVGDYTVSLTVENDDGSDIKTVIDYISVESEPAEFPPITHFTANTTSGDKPLSVQFNDTSENTPTEWYWIFGDGNTSTQQNPVHTYVTAGLYTVRLKTTNEDGFDWENKTDYINVTTYVEPAPVADFTANTTSGVVPKCIQFTDLSTNNVTSWNWSFGDGNYSSLQNPSHTYTEAGTYTVSLTATGSGGEDTETKVDYLTFTAPQPPVANFVASSTLVGINQPVQFTSLATGASTWNWTFGDGNFSLSTNPSHQYASIGNYTVSLTVTNIYGEDTETKVSYIQVVAEWQLGVGDLQHEVGEEWIRWSWTNFSAAYRVYIDGQQVETNLTKCNYYLHGINPAEEHIIRVESALDSARFLEGTATTVQNSVLITFLMAIAFLLMVVTLFIRNDLHTVVLGGLSLVIEFYLLLQCVGHGGLWLVIIAMMIFQSVFVIRSLYHMLEGALAWY